MPFVVDFQKCSLCGEYHNFVFDDIPSMSKNYPFVCPETGKSGKVKPGKAAHKTRAVFVQSEVKNAKVGKSSK